MKRFPTIHIHTFSEFRMFVFNYLIVNNMVERRVVNSKSRKGVANGMVWYGIKRTQTKCENEKMRKGKAKKIIKNKNEIGIFPDV